jgi:D-amino-acid oxidase
MSERREPPVVVVVGGGVIGLTCAMELAETLQERVRVEVWCERRGQAPPNALWEVPPYKVEPQAEAVQWALASLRKLQHLATHEPRAGVHMIRYYVVSRSAEALRDPSVSGDAYAAQLIEYEHSPDVLTRHDALRRLLAAGYVDAAVQRVPVVRSVQYLNWLELRLAALGVVVRRGFAVDSLATAARRASALAVVNCAGLGADRLAGDDERQCYPIKGQILAVDAPWIDFAMTDADSGAYVIPAPGAALEVGGTADADVWDRTPSAADTSAIRTSVAQMLPSLAAVEPDDCWTGLRPARRAGVRLEATRCARTGALLVHNYGHGGAGFVCSYGCAARVVEWVAQELAAKAAKL